MKKIYLTLIALNLCFGLMAQVISIGSDLGNAASGNRYRSPWTPAYAYSYVQTIYLQTEINRSGTISSVSYSFLGTALENSNDIEVYMGTTSKSVFDGSYADWIPVSAMVKVFDGHVSVNTMPGAVTINLQTPYNYTNAGNLVIAVFDKSPGSDYVNSKTAFEGSDVGTSRTMYYVTDGPEANDDPIPDPSNPANGNGVRTYVGNIKINFGAVAPVTLSDFTVSTQINSNILRWTTQTERNNTGFDIQRSIDGNTFTSIGFVKSNSTNGNSSSALDYSYNDLNPVVGNNYYRLKQVDLDDKSTYSKVVSIKNTQANMSINIIYPNPVKSDLNIVLSSLVNETAQISITSLEGKTLWQTTQKLSIGVNKISMNPSGFSAGIYSIKVVYGGGKESTTCKFVKE